MQCTKMSLASSTIENHQRPACPTFSYEWEIFIWRKIKIIAQCNCVGQDIFWQGSADCPQWRQAWESKARAVLTTGCTMSYSELYLLPCSVQILPSTWKMANRVSTKCFLYPMMWMMSGLWLGNNGYLAPFFNRMWSIDHKFKQMERNKKYSLNALKIIKKAH